MTKPRTNGFTLIEMLTVIAIIGVLLAATIPAVTQLMKSSGLNIAVRQVSTTLSLARQMAITQRVYARVVFPYSGSPAGYEDMRYRTYAVMTNGDNTVGLAWRYVSKWEYLPVGVVFLNLNPTGVTPTPVGAGALDDLTSLKQEPVLPFPDASNPGNVGKLVFIEFTPSGAATPLTAGTLAPSVLAITEGFTSGGTPTPTSRSTSNTVANYATLTINPLLGRIQVTRP